MEVVIVSGAGGPAGMALIKELAHGQYESVIAVDSSPTAVGIHFRGDLFITGSVVPEATHPLFVDSINELARKHDATAFISTIPEEMMTVGIEVPHWFPTSHAVLTCTDKWSFYKAMCDADIPVPETGYGAFEVRGPWIVKPRFGSGSKNVRRMTDPFALGTIIRHSDIVQTEIKGREFTADCLVTHHGSPVACVPRWRIETRGGISTHGETFRSDEVTRLCYKVLDTVGLTGVANVQGFVTDNEVVIIECNPRFSGGLPLSLYAGADIVGQYLRGIHRRPMIAQSFRPGKKMYRYFSEVFE